MNIVKMDLLSVTRGLIVHGCNAQGVMGSGVALAVKNKYPLAFRIYVNLIQHSDRYPMGDVAYAKINDELYICNAITQENYGRVSHTRYVSYDAVDESLDNVMTMAKAVRLPVYMPKIGAGLGNGSWDVIAQIIEHNRKKHSVPEDQVTICVV